MCPSYHNQLLTLKPRIKPLNSRLGNVTARNDGYSDVLEWLTKAVEAVQLDDCPFPLSLQHYVFEIAVSDL